MLLLVTIGLVVVAAAALMVGFVNNQLGPIYVSIFCSALAGLVLVLFSRLSRRHGPAIASAGGPTPLSRFGAAFQSRPSAPRVAAPAPALTPTFGASRPASPPPPLEPVADEEQPGWAEEPWFPIDDYDDMRVAEILPLLPELDLDELDQLREHEAEGKARASVLIRIDELIADLEEVSGGPAPEEDQPQFPIEDYDRRLGMEEDAALPARPARPEAAAVPPTPAPTPLAPVKRAPAVEEWEPEVEWMAPAKVAAATAKAAMMVETVEPPAGPDVPVSPVPPGSPEPPGSPVPPLAPAPGPPKPRLAMKAAASAIKKPPPVKTSVTKQAPAAKRR